MMRQITTVAVLFIAAAACPVCTSQGPSISCCLSVSNKRIHPHHIASYSVQEAVLCPVRAVVPIRAESYNVTQRFETKLNKEMTRLPLKFHTRHGKNVCADPDQEWVRRAMRRVDEEQEKAVATAGGY